MAPRKIEFSAVRACIFDMDELLINSEDIITQSTNQFLEGYGRPPFTRSIRAQLMGVPDSTNGDIFHNLAQLPISREQWAREWSENLRLNFPDCKPLPGAEKLLLNLSRACGASSGDAIELALASGSETDSYERKTSNPATKQLLSFFQPDKRVLGDDPRVRQGRGKPAPDIYLVALESLNASARASGAKPIMPNECLVFDDSVIGVEAGRRAGMRVVWVPHPDMAVEYQTKQADVLEYFDYEKYGISVSSETSQMHNKDQ
ncbi:Uu.00g085400.m01.CDS01 [Anthostomella pinea]|uniref:Uu.00g085400.m01.CDS01 n=1 Tax=Anthostomella pinea TaxID=933095 RepID=A0AAI8VLZ2_9PEZI|nr:Uu.00g085400.m01.CDS01 [Anthostomella pinea]